MAGSNIILISVIVIGFFLVLYFISIYNALVKLKNRFGNAFSQIDVQLKRRNDLIPNLVEVAKGYIKHERETLEAVVAARTKAVTAGELAVKSPENAEAMKGLIGAESVLSGALGKMFAVMESYPDLKANQNMLQLQEELTSTENKISFARQSFNDAVTVYNIKTETFPDVFVANLFGFKKAEMFLIEDKKEKEVPKIAF
ncbi:MAG: hypothetical protein ACD_79C00429G0002 [uncultured bacterium]|nr:MAG: hypothetical protein ACD_79C00429G0002 [uncultured bacterium]